MSGDIPAINKQISAHFYQKASILENKGAKNKFRALSYIRAAKAVASLASGLDDIYNKSWLAGLQKIKGIGNRLAHEIETEIKKRNLINK